jgi:hypothetical protein
MTSKKGKSNNKSESHKQIPFGDDKQKRQKQQQEQKQIPFGDDKQKTDDK